MAKNPNKQWDRCLYCDASIAGDDAHVASLHDPYCPHGKSLLKLDEALKDAERWKDHNRQFVTEYDALDKTHGETLAALEGSELENAELQSRLDEQTKLADRRLRQAAAEARVRQRDRAVLQWGLANKYDMALAISDEDAWENLYSDWADDPASRAFVPTEGYESLQDRAIELERRLDKLIELVRLADSDLLACEGISLGSSMKTCGHLKESLEIGTFVVERQGSFEQIVGDPEKKTGLFKPIPGESE